jgi:hypothetical protein
VNKSLSNEGLALVKILLYTFCELDYHNESCLVESEIHELKT